MARGIKRRVHAALNAANRSVGAHDGSKYARGLSTEGYMGGYCAALRDVLLLLDGVEPNDSRGLWSSDQRGPSYPDGGDR